MKELTQKKKSPRFFAALCVFGLVGQIAWVIENMYLNVFIYEMFGASADDISRMVAASAVAATLTTVVMGALSDKVGRRRLFIAGGYVLWGVSIIGFALVRTDTVSALFPAVASVSAICITLVIALDCVMTFFGSTANDAAFNAWLTDATADGGRGAAEGLNSMMPLLSILVVFGGFMSFDLSRAESWNAIFLTVGIAVLLIGVLGFFLIEETAKPSEENAAYFKNIVYGFRPSVVKRHPMLYLTLIGFAVFGTSIQIFMPYLILYYNKTLAMDNYVFVMAPAIILASVVTALYGRLYDKWGFRKTLVPSLSMLAAGYLVLFFFTHTALVFIGSLLMMSGYLTGAAVFGAMLRDRTPVGKAGMFQGLRIVGQVLIPGVVGPAIGAFVLRNADTVVNGDGTLSFLPNASIFMAALITILVLVAFLVPFFYLLKREESKARD